MKQHVIWRITSAWQANHQEQRLPQSSNYNSSLAIVIGLNLGFTSDGLTQLLGAGRPRLDPFFEWGAEAPETIERLHDPPLSSWLREFRSDRIDGIFLVAAPREGLANSHRAELLRLLGDSIKVVYSEMGTTGPAHSAGSSTSVIATAFPSRGSAV